MGTFFLSLIIFLLAMAGLALGVIMGGTPLRGSCGGISCVKDAGCAACPKRKAKP